MKRTWQYTLPAYDVHFEQILVKIKLIVEQHLNTSTARRLQSRRTSLEQSDRSMTTPRTRWQSDFVSKEDVYSSAANNRR